MPAFIRNSLRIKLTLLFTLMVFVFTCTHVFIRYTSTLPQLYALEVAKDKKDIKKLVLAFERIASEMQMLVNDKALYQAKETGRNKVCVSSVHAHQAAS